MRCPLFNLSLDPFPSLKAGGSHKSFALPHFHGHCCTAACLFAPPAPSPADCYCHPCLQAVPCFRITLATTTVRFLKKKEFEFDKNCGRGVKAVQIWYELLGQAGWAQNYWQPTAQKLSVSPCCCWCWWCEEAQPCNSMTATVLNCHLHRIREAAHSVDLQRICTLQCTAARARAGAQVSILRDTTADAACTIPVLGGTWVNTEHWIQLWIIFTETFEHLIWFLKTETQLLCSNISRIWESTNIECFLISGEI